MKHLKMKVIWSTFLLLGMGLVIVNPVKAETFNVGGGLWDYGLTYNWIWQQSQYSNFWHPNWHRSSSLQDTTLIRSVGSKTIGQYSYTKSNSWSYSKTGYWYPWQWRSYYDYLNYGN